MRRDQLLFLLIGIGLGAVLGAVVGVVAVRPELVGAQSAASAPQSAQNMGQAASQGGQQISQVQELKQALSKNPKDPNALASLGEQLMEAGLVQQGLEHFRRALDHNPDNSVLHFRAARAFRAAGEREYALSLAQKGMELDPDRWEAAEAVFDHAFYGAGDFAAAEKALEELEERKPDYGRLEELQSNLQEVRSVVEKAQSGAEDFDTQVRAGNFFYDIQQWSNAEACYERALELDPDRPEVITDMGTVIGRQGHSQDAYDLFERALRVDSDYWKAAHNGIVIALRTNDQDAANRWLGKLKALRPDHPTLNHLQHQVAAMGQRSQGGPMM